MFISKYYHKGDGIQLTGRFESDKYTDKNGQNRTTWGLTVDQAFFPLGKGKSEQGNASPVDTTVSDDDMPF